MQFLLLEHLTAKQMAEDAQANGRALNGTGLHPKIIVDLPAYDATDNHSHQETYHPDDILLSASMNGDVDEPFAEPHHQQTERHAPDAGKNANQHVPTDSCRVMPYPG